MKRPAAVLGSALFLVLAPGTVAGLVPWWITHWWAPPHHPALTALGWVLIGLGGVLLADCFARFALQGLGTPAPVAPTARLVVSGAYRWVRNPMYVAVTALILGQAAVFASLPLMLYGYTIWAAFHAFVLGYEEPTLRRTFPDAYAAFFAAVPRWIPRLTPWKG